MPTETGPVVPRSVLLNVLELDNRQFFRLDREQLDLIEINAERSVLQPVAQPDNHIA